LRDSREAWISDRALPTGCRRAKNQPRAKTIPGNPGPTIGPGTGSGMSVCGRRSARSIPCRNSCRGCGWRFCCCSPAATVSFSQTEAARQLADTSAATVRATRTTMSKKAAEHHRKASEHHSHAARHHEEAAKHHDSGHHEKAAHHAHTAGGHAIHARDHAEEARKAHTEEYGKK
jgi:hypothetical protein